MKIIYNPGKVKSCISVNAYLSRFFPISKGLRQGCPLSPLLYIIVAETFANKIRSDPEVKGIFLGNQILKLNHYADDMNFFLSDENSVEKVFSLFKSYTRAPGASLNLDKTQILKLGNINLFTFLKYVAERVKIYGIYFTTKGFDRDKSFEQAEASIRKLSTLYPHSEFSLESRSIFINTYFLSKFWYSMAFIKPPDKLIQLANNAIVRFLWYPSRMPKMKGIIIKNSKEFGGDWCP